MLSIPECKKILRDGGLQLTNEEIEKLREALYFLARAAKEELLIQKTKEHENSGFIRPGLN